MVSKAVRLAVLFIVTAVSPLVAQQTASQLANLRHWSGQGVAPVYEGFDINADGSFNMWFGYMNRNYEEALDLPVGAANAFEPGGDRGSRRISRRGATRTCSASSCRHTYWHPRAPACPRRPWSHWCPPRH